MYWCEEMNPLSGITTSMRGSRRTCVPLFCAGHASPLKTTAPIRRSLRMRCPENRIQWRGLDYAFLKFLRESRTMTCAVPKALRDLRVYSGEISAFSNEQCLESRLSCYPGSMPWCRCLALDLFPSKNPPSGYRSFAPFEAWGYKKDGDTLFPNFENGTHRSRNRVTTSTANISFANTSEG